MQAVAREIRRPVIAALAGISGLVGYSGDREDFVGTLQVAFCDAVGALHAVVAMLSSFQQTRIQARTAGSV